MTQDPANIFGDILRHKLDIPWNYGPNYIVDCILSGIAVLPQEKFSKIRTFSTKVIWTDGRRGGRSLAGSERCLSWVSSAIIVLAAVAFSQSSAVGQTVQVSNITHPGIAPNFIVGDQFSITISGAANAPVAVTQYANGALGSPYTFGSTGPGGSLTLSGTQTSSTIGSYTQIWTVGGVAAPAISFVVTASPVVKFTNLTHPGLAPDFEPNDSFRIDVAGPPNQAVSVVQTFDGTTGSPNTFGSTDGSGNLSLSGVQPPSNVGTYTQVWSVGGIAATPAITFTVSQPGGGGTVTVSELGETSDGNIQGASTVSITNGAISTYSATELDAAAQYWYDSGAVYALFDNGSEVQTNTVAGGGIASGSMYATANDWDDYNVQTDHYVIAFFIEGYGYYNPYGYEEGSCDDDGDCTIGSGGGAIYVGEAWIYLGSTIADQTYVPQGVIPSLASDNDYDEFLSSAPSPQPTGPMLIVDAWRAAITVMIPLIQQWQGNSGSSAYPIPFLVQLTDDTESSQNGATPAQRTRLYMLKDQYGRPWNDSNPVNVWETLTYDGSLNLSGGPGPAAFPSADATNPSNTSAAAWHPGGDWEGTSSFFDYYYINPLENGYQVWYFQAYFASNFNAPGFPWPSSLTFSIPGVTGMTGGQWAKVLGGPVVPLMIVSKKTQPPPAPPNDCMRYGVQGVFLSSPWVGINGDTSIAKPPGCGSTYP